MSVTPINSSSFVQKAHPVNQKVTPTAEDAAAFEASLGEASEAASDNSNDSSQQNGNSSYPTASWDQVHEGFNHLMFDHARREFAYYDEQRKEIDYGNKT